MDVRKTNTVSPKKRVSNLSKDRKWRSFPKVPHLLQYVSSGQYYARVKVNGKTIRRSLKTKIWTTAKLRLVDFLKEQNESRGETPTPTFADAVNIYERAIRSSARLKASSLEYRLLCLKRIKASWPELWKLPLDQVSIQQCRDWAALQSKEVAACYYNNLIATLRLVFAAGVEEHRRRGGRTIENPAQVLPRVRVKQKELKLPESAQFRALLKNLRLRSGGWGRRVADLIEFLAYSGMRIRSEALWVAWEDVDWQKKEIVVRGHPETGTKNSEVRRVPMITDMEGLLLRLSGKGKCSGRILKVTRAHEALARACSELGMPRLTHHDFRHLFATRCIESGVDIPTVARWLGHKDGGALAMKTYGHLRNEHSQAMAEKVRF